MRVRSNEAGSGAAVDWWSLVSDMLNAGYGFGGKDIRTQVIFGYFCGVTCLAHMVTVDVGRIMTLS